LADTLIPRIAKGAGTAEIKQLVYPVDPKIAQLKDTKSITLLGTDRPIAFFAYPGKPSLPEPADCHVAPLCAPTMTSTGTSARWLMRPASPPALPWQPSRWIFPMYPRRI